MGRPSAADRARTMLALLQNLEPGTELTLDELAERVGTSAEQVADDVTTLSMCGVAPYDPGDLVSAFVDEGRVHVFAPPPALDRRVRLSAGEARALLTALQSAGFDAHSELAERLTGAATPEFSASELEQRLQAASPAAVEGVYATLAHAVATSSVVRVAYQSTGAADAGERDIEPMSLFGERGVWYTSAFCRSSQGMRTFRLDRVRDARALEERFDPTARTAADLPFSGEGLPLARLRFADASSFSARDWPGATLVETDRDGLLVDVPFAGTAWMARQVCARLGDVSVEGPPEVRAAVAATATTIADQLAP